MCIHDDIRDCPLYMGMHIPNGPSCMTKDLDNGCAVNQAGGEDGRILYDRLLLALRTKYPHDVGQVEWRAMGRAIERGEKPTCQLAPRLTKEQKMAWFESKSDERITKRCATDGCGSQATWRLEADGVGSYHCSGCREKINSRAWVARQAQEFAARNPDREP